MLDYVSRVYEGFKFKLFLHRSSRLTDEKSCNCVITSSSSTTSPKRKKTVQISTYQVEPELPLVPLSPTIKRSTVSYLQIKDVGQRRILATSSGKYFEMIRTVRETIYGEVLFGLELLKNESGELLRTKQSREVAIKITNRKRLSSNPKMLKQENPIKEIAIMQFLKQLEGHDNIIQYIDCGYDSTNLYSIMEFVNGSELYDVVHETGKLTELQTKTYFKQIVNGLQYLHSLSLSHRDLSLENVLITNNTNESKIIDFGMSIRYNKDQCDPITLSKVLTGKKNYIAPEAFNSELLNFELFNPYLSDIWALGIMLFIMVTGRPPMDSAQLLDTRYHLIVTKGLNELLNKWNINDLSIELIDLLNSILKPNPADRISLQEILKHPWLNDV